MKKILVLFFFIMFVIGTDTFLLSPLLPQLQVEFGVSKDVSGWMVGTYAIGYALFALVVGPLSDGLNRKHVMTFGMIAFAISTILCGTATNFATMLIYRLLAGISASIVAPQVWASIATLFSQKQMVAAMGVATAGLAVSQAIGVPIGSFFAIFHWSTPFYVIGGLSCILVLLITLFVPNLLPDREKDIPSILQRYRDLLNISHAREAFLSYFLFQTGNFATFTFIGTWLSDRFFLDEVGIGFVMLWIGIGNVLGSFLSSVITKKFGKARTLLAGTILMACLYVIVSSFHILLDVKFTYFIIFTIAGILFPIMMSRLASLSASLRGTISSLASAVMYAATTIGSVLAGFLYVYVGGFTAICSFMASCYLLSIVLCIRGRVFGPEVNI